MQRGARRFAIAAALVLTIANGLGMMEGTTGLKVKTNLATTAPPTTAPSTTAPPTTAPPTTAPPTTAPPTTAPPTTAPPSSCNDTSFIVKFKKGMMVKNQMGLSQRLGHAVKELSDAMLKISRNNSAERTVTFEFVGPSCLKHDQALEQALQKNEKLVLSALSAESLQHVMQGGETKRHGNKAGFIVAGILGGFVVIALAACLLHRRRQAVRQSEQAPLFFEGLPGGEGMGPGDGIKGNGGTGRRMDGLYGGV